MRCNIESKLSLFHIMSYVPLDNLFKSLALLPWNRILDHFVHDHIGQIHENNSHLSCPAICPFVCPAIHFFVPGLYRTEVME